MVRLSSRIPNTDKFDTSISFLFWMPQNSQTVIFGIDWSYGSVWQFSYIKFPEGKIESQLKSMCFVLLLNLWFKSQ